MYSNRLPRSSNSSACAPAEHPAEAFLRGAGVKYARSTEDPTMLLLHFVLEHGTVKALLHRHPDHKLMVLHFCLPVRADQPRALRETARLCNLMNSALPSGQFALDESDGEVTFRSGHFFGPDGLPVPAFGDFFEHCLGAVSVALPAFQLVAEGLGSAADTVASVVRPHSN